MSLANRINDDIKTAMKAKDRERLNALRSIKSALLLEATSAGASQITEADEIKILQKQLKQRKEAIEMYTSQGRDADAEEDKLQAAVIESYLPAALSEDEVEAKVAEIIASTGASSMADMGKVMGQASKAMPGTDGKLISSLVRKALA